MAVVSEPDFGFGLWTCYHQWCIGLDWVGGIGGADAARRLVPFPTRRVGLRTAGGFIMTIDRMHQGDALRRIAESNSAVAPGKGLGPDHFVPAFSINNRGLALQLKQRLANDNIVATLQVDRLCTRFFVTRENLAVALRIRDEFLAQMPDSKPRRISQDYDSVFLLTPFIILAAYFSHAAPWIPKYVWIAISISGITAMLFAERINRQYRSYLGSQLGMRDLFFATAAIAVNIIVWRTVL